MEFQIGLEGLSRWLAVVGADWKATEDSTGKGTGVPGRGCL